MNRYGQMAMTHWQTWLPTRHSELSDPMTFYADLGEQVAAMIAEETSQATSRLTPNPDYLRAVGQWNAVRQGIEERIVSEMILLEPEPQTQDLPQVPLETPAGMPADPQHPLWAMQEDESVSVEAFRAALRQWRATLPTPQD
ncbi:MAG: hypothetical protein Q4G34_01000 [Micrococcus sp.]|nr:hypothetical protein [Micrococcus sp.]